MSLFAPGDIVVVLMDPTHKALGTVESRSWIESGVYFVSVGNELREYRADDLAAVPGVRR